MRENYTHITIILDRTGSMDSIRDDTIGGFNAFVEKQKAETGMATLTLVQFDSQDPYEMIHRFLPIALVPLLTRATYVPRASTPLLDAMGRGIIDLEQSLSELKEDDRPSKVVIVVVTDGQENASREFHRSQIEQMIREKSEKNHWQFVFLSADLAAISDARSVGYQQDSVLLFKKDREGTHEAWGSLCARTSDFRQARRANLNFDESDRKHPKDPNKDPNRNNNQEN